MVICAIRRFKIRDYLKKFPSINYRVRENSEAEPYISIMGVVLSKTSKIRTYRFNI